MRKLAVLFISMFVLLSCNENISRDGGVNLNIHPYLRFTETEDGLEASVLDGASVSKLFVPSECSMFNGFENPEDAARLKELVIGSETEIDPSFFEVATNLERIERTDIKDDSVWKLPETMPDVEGYHFLGWKAGGVFVKNGDPIDRNNTTVIPLYEKHRIIYAYDLLNHWLECSVCHKVLGEKEEHTFVNDSYCEICGYVKGSAGNSGGFDVDVEFCIPEGHLVKESLGDNRYKISFVDDQKNEKYKATSFEWYVGQEKVEGEGGSFFVFEASSTRTYTVMCIFKNEYGAGSDSVYID